VRLTPHLIVASRLQDWLVSLQERDRYCGAFAGSTIRGMNTSANTNQIHTTATVDARTTPVGFRRRTMAGTLLVTMLTAVAVGFAATSHADDDAPNPGTDAAIVAPAPPAIPLPPPPPPPPVLPWVGGLLDWALHPHMHCGYRGFQDKFRCDWY
jgi:hypothetical protein